MNNNSESSAVTNDPVFVIGNIRSGTSLLMYLLNQHSRIALMYEASFFKVWTYSDNLFFRNSKRHRFEKWSQVFSRHGMSLSSSEKKLSLQNFMTSSYKEYAHIQNKDIYGEKSPSYADMLLRLYKEFPAARFIIIYRNPLNIISSIKSAGLQSSTFSSHFLIRQTLVLQQKLIQQTEKLKELKASIHELKMEDLTHNPEQELKSICRFLGISYEPDMVKLKNADLSSLPEGTHHSTLRSRKINKNPPVKAAIDPKTTNMVLSCLRDWKSSYPGSKGVDYNIPDNIQSQRAGTHILNYLSWIYQNCHKKLVSLCWLFTPQPLISAYRKLKNHHHTPATKTGPRP